MRHTKALRALRPQHTTTQRVRLSDHAVAVGDHLRALVDETLDEVLEVDRLQVPSTRPKPFTASRLARRHRSPNSRARL